MKRIKDLPLWLVGGIIVFPIIGSFGLLEFLLEKEPSPFFWATFPAIIFEELFEKSFPAFSDSLFFNFSFLVLFYFFLGSLTGTLVERLHLRKDEQV